MTQLPDQSQFGDYGEWPGRDVLDSGGERLGDVREIYLDRETGRPEWVLVQVEREESRFVPLADANVESRSIRVAHPATLVRSAPPIGAEPRIDQDQERELYAHYHIGYSSQDSGSGLPDDSVPPPEPTSEYQTYTGSAVTESDQPAPFRADTPGAWAADTPVPFAAPPADFSAPTPVTEPSATEPPFTAGTDAPPTAFTPPAEEPAAFDPGPPSPFTPVTDAPPSALPLESPGSFSAPPTADTPATGAPEPDAPPLDPPSPFFTPPAADTPATTAPSAEPPPRTDYSPPEEQSGLSPARIATIAAAALVLLLILRRLR